MKSKYIQSLRKELCSDTTAQRIPDFPECMENLRRCLCENSFSGLIVTNEPICWQQTATRLVGETSPEVNYFLLCLCVRLQKEAKRSFGVVLICSTWIKHQSCYLCAALAASQVKISLQQPRLMKPNEPSVCRPSRPPALRRPGGNKNSNLDKLVAVTKRRRSCDWTAGPPAASAEIQTRSGVQIPEI